MAEGDIRQFLIVELFELKYAIELRWIRRVIEMVEITLVPKAPNYVKGIFNLEGNIVAAVDLRTILNISPKEYDEDTAIVVAELKDEQIGLIVDYVQDLILVNSDQIKLIDTGENESQLIQGLFEWEEQLYRVFDLEKVVSE